MLLSPSAVAKRRKIRKKVLFSPSGASPFYKRQSSGVSDRLYPNPGVYFSYAWFLASLEAIPRLLSKCECPKGWIRPTFLFLEAFLGLYPTSYYTHEISSLRCTAGFDFGPRLNFPVRSRRGSVRTCTQESCRFGLGSSNKAELVQAPDAGQWLRPTLEVTPTSHHSPQSSRKYRFSGRKLGGC